MASGFGNLSGSGPQQVWANVAYQSYNQAGNYSTWYYEVRYYGNGYGSWTNSTQSWSISGFVNSSGTFTIPQSQAYATYMVLANGYFNKGHNADGYLSAGNSTASISTNHSSIGSGSVTVSSGTPPRIPKVPDAPTGLNVTAVNPSTIGASWTAPADNGGSTITSYRVRVDTDPSMNTATVYSTPNASLSYQVTGQTPGQTYYVQVAAVNGIGTGPYSTVDSVRVGIGGKRHTGSSFISFSTAKRFNGSAFVDITTAKRFNGSSWVDLT